MKISRDEIARLPVHLSRLVEAVDEETNTRVRIWQSFELSELILKWVFAVTTSAVFAERGRLTDRMLNVIRDSIKTPTLGGWQNMATVACEDARKLEGPNFDIGPFADYFLGQVQGKDADKNVWERIKDRRNKVVHGGGLTENQARKLWADISDDLEPIVRDLSILHDSYDVWARFAGETYNLEGPVTQQAPCPFEIPDDDGAWLIDGEGRHCTLRPLLVYEPVQETWEIDQVRTEEREVRSPVPQSYFKFDKGQLYYTPIGVDDFISIDANTSLFDRMFAGQRHNASSTIHAQTLEMAHQVHVRRFQGRENELSRIDNWITKNIPEGGRIGLVVGGPGLGKSALMARAAHLYEDAIRAASTRARRSIFHVFNAENPFNDRRSFLLNLRQQLQLWLDRKPAKSSAIGNVQEQETLVFNLLGEALQASEGRHLTIFVDGLDEIRANDPKFLTFLRSLLRPGVSIVGSSRNEAFITDFEAEDDVEIIEFAGGVRTLPGMTNREVRALLLQGLGSRAKEIIAFDIDDESETRVVNPYVERVVSRADGKPLYVELLIADIIESGARIDPDARLPVSMEGFYEQLLSRQGLSDAKTHLAILLCLLALAKEPLGEEALTELLFRSPGVVRTRSKAAGWVRRAIGQGEVFLRAADTSDDEPKFVIYHQELKRFILGPHGEGAPQMQWAFSLAKWLLASCSVSPERHESGPVSRHFVRYGPEYLLEFGDSVRPSVMDQAAVDHVENHVFSEDGLQRYYPAWNEDNEGFLDGYARILLKIRDASDLKATDPALLSLISLMFNNPQYGLSPGVVHAVYSYNTQTAPIFDRLISIIQRPEFVGREDLGADAKTALAEWIIRAGSMDRRKGALDRAEEAFDMASGLIADLPDQDQKTAARLYALLNYEQGYVHYSRSDLDRTDAVFVSSVRNARLAGDLNGEFIAESVRLDRKLKFAVSEERVIDDVLQECEMFLSDALEKFAKTYADTDDDMERLTAERWLMNCKAHLFEASFYAGDKEKALSRYEDLLADGWIKKIDPTLREEIISRFRRRAMWLEGNIQDAVAAYSSSLPIITNEDLSAANKEGVAEHYLEFGKLLTEAGDLVMARKAYESGLLASDEMANTFWKPAIRQALADLRD